MACFDLWDMVVTGKKLTISVAAALLVSRRSGGSFFETLCRSVNVSK